MRTRNISNLYVGDVFVLNGRILRVSDFDSMIDVVYAVSATNSQSTKTYEIERGTRVKWLKDFDIFTVLPGGRKE